MPCWPTLSTHTCFSYPTHKQCSSWWRPSSSSNRFFFFFGGGFILPSQTGKHKERKEREDRKNENDEKQEKKETKEKNQIKDIVEKEYVADSQNPCYQQFSHPSSSWWFVTQKSDKGSEVSRKDKTESEHRKGAARKKRTK
jgi:hypothetical protein